MQQTELSPVNQRLSALRFVGGLILSLALVLAQAFPVSASHTGQSGNWIEICSEYGIELVQFEDRQQPDECPCEVCSCCLMPVASGLDRDGQQPFAAPFVFFTIAESSILQGLFVERAEQYWATKRGPPDASIVNSMTKIPSLAGKKPFGPILNREQLPWI